MPDFGSEVMAEALAQRALVKPVYTIPIIPLSSSNQYRHQDHLDMKDYKKVSRNGRHKGRYAELRNCSQLCFCPSFSKTEEAKTSDLTHLTLQRRLDLDSRLFRGIKISPLHVLLMQKK